MKLSRMFIYGLFLIISGTAKAENTEFKKAHGDFFHLLHSSHEDIKASYTFERGTEEDGGPGKYDLNHFLVSGELVLPFTRDSFARVGGTYGARLYDFNQTANGALDETTLHRVELLGGLGGFVNDDILLTGNLRAGTYSDFESGFETDDFKLYGEALAGFRLNPGAQLLFGARVSKDFDDAPIIPLIGFRMLSDNGKFHVNLTLPVELKLTYFFDPAIEGYLIGSLIGEQYRVDAKNSDDRFNLYLQDRRLGLGLGWWALSSVKIGLEAGVSLGSELEFKTNSDAFDGDLDPNGYFNASFGVAL